MKYGTYDWMFGKFDMPVSYQKTKNQGDGNVDPQVGGYNDMHLEIKRINP